MMILMCQLVLFLRNIVEKGDILGYIHGNDEDKVKIVLKQDLFIIG